MIKGSFIVKDDIDIGDSAKVQQALDDAPAIAQSRGGCGCGMM
jgi:hypothetical protein